MMSVRGYSSQYSGGPRSITHQTTTASDAVSSLPQYILIRAPTPYQAIVKPILFTVVASFGTFATAAYIWERHQVTLIKRIQAWRSQSKIERVTAKEFVQAQSEILKEQWSDILERYRWIQEIGIPLEIQKMIFVMRSRWMELTPGERTIWGIIALNTAVFGAWQVPRLSPFMHKWFMHHPAQDRSITLLTSMFSHQHFWHFGLNMFALYSFAVPLHDHMGMEQFLAFYITTGISASLVSHLFTVARVPWSKMIPSLGASGALFGCVSSTAYMYPDASVYIIFLPFLPIKIPVALGAMMGLDLVGIIKNWKFFDHYAHLAGATFGLAYMYAGKELIWTPLQQKAIELNKDANLFVKSGPKSSPPAVEVKPARSWGFSDITAGDTKKHTPTAKEYAEARVERIKAWWDSTKNGGNK
ncbi:hypothetical protein BG011_010129 [Mortierella polycephala]|uniref:Peptidase S54 rhomboid domain-containing protein n=1 Tax=Mortierella polycephala TaxID=41804 RepID=A0A9P6PK56_9FUNG|nr:hypothetical protein BG011_010129 [Mortierella polycephala]